MADSVTLLLIGGPADLQRHQVPSATISGGVYRVPTMPVQFAWAPAEYVDHASSIEVGIATYRVMRLPNPAYRPEVMFVALYEGTGSTGATREANQLRFERDKALKKLDDASRAIRGLVERGD